MRASGLVLATMAGLSVAGAAMAQALTGPLAPTDGPPTVARSTAKRSVRRAKTVTIKREAFPGSARTPSLDKPAVPAPEPVAASSIERSSPLSLGMKWNGSNDNAAQTRIENLNGQAAGTGAEVGMKLHF